MDRGLDFSLSELIAVAPKTNHYRQKIHDKLRSYFFREGRTVVDRRVAHSAATEIEIAKGKIEWASIFDDLSQNKEFIEIISDHRGQKRTSLISLTEISRNSWSRNLIQNSSKSPPGGGDKYHMSLLYWMLLPRHQVWNTAELNRIGNDLCADIFQMSAAEKVAQMRATKKAIQSSPVVSPTILPTGHEIATAESGASKFPRLRPSYARVLKHSDAYQKSRDEFRIGKGALLASGEQSKASATAIYGAGGYGKSSLAQELCDDSEIQARFRGGIYWLQFGLIDSNDEKAGAIGLAQAIDRMLVAQYPKAERPCLSWDNRDSDIRTLLDVLPDEPVLIVADDLWTGWQAGWLSEVPPHVSVLVTTRVHSVARQVRTEVPIKRLPDDASYKLLTHGMEDIPSGRQTQFKEVAKNLKGWPLLLNLANGIFKQMGGDSNARIDRALSEYEQFLKDDQIDGWDIHEAAEGVLSRRHKLVGFCIEAGLNAIHPENEPALLRALAVFTDDAEIPFSVTIDFWGRIAVKRVSQTRGLSLLRHFNDFSFFSSFDEDGRSFRLHDEILAYFHTSAGDQRLQALHLELLTSIQAHCRGGWDTLPHDHKYGWTRVLHHMEKAGRTDEANDLRTNFQWLKAKLAAVGASELQRSFLPMPFRMDARSVGRALNVSVPALTARPRSLAHQLYGRLGNERDARVRKLAQAARSDADCWPLPRKPHLSPPNAELLRLVGHSDWVFHAAFDPTGRRVVTASRDGTAQVWDAESGMPVGERFGRTGRVKIAAFDSSGRKIVTGSYDGSVQLWDAETDMSNSIPLEGHNGQVNTAVFDQSGRKVISASDDATARLWDAETGLPIGNALAGHTDKVREAAFDPSGRTIVTISDDGTMRLWNAETGAPTSEPIDVHLAYRVAFDPSGERVAVAYDNTARIWSIQTGAPLWEPLKGHSGYVFDVSFNPNGGRLVTASYDGTARLWDAETGGPIGKPLQGHSDSVDGAIFHPTGRSVLTFSRDGTARLWDAETGMPIGKPIDGHDGAILSAAFDPSGHRILTASKDGSARLWSAEPESSAGDRQPSDSEFALRAGLDLTGRRVVTVSRDGSAHLRDIETGRTVGGPLAEHGEFIDAVFDPDGRKLASVLKNHVVQLWDAGTGEPLGQTIKAHHDWILSLRFDPLGQKLLTTSKDGTARLWDALTGAPLGMPLQHTSWVVRGIFDRNSSRIVTASFDATAHLWNTGSCKPENKPLQGHTKTVVNAAFDSSGSKIVTASFDGTARIWDAETGEPIAYPLIGHSGPVLSATFDPSGDKILTGSKDGTARLWDTATGSPVCKPLKGHDGWVHKAVFDPSGRVVLTASRDRTVRLWEASTGNDMAIVDFDEIPSEVTWSTTQVSVGLSPGRVQFFEIARHLDPQFRCFAAL